MATIQIIFNIPHILHGSQKIHKMEFFYISNVSLRTNTPNWVDLTNIRMLRFPYVRKIYNRQ